MTLSSLDTWSFWLTVTAIVLPTMGGVAAFLALYFSSRAASIRDTDLAHFKADSQTKIATLELEGGHQRERAANAERALLELQERARPRTLDPGARALLIESLQFGGYGDKTIDVEYVGGSTSEPHDFGAALVKMLREAGWTVTSFDGGPALGAPPIGLSLRIPDQYGGSDKAFGLASALERAGFNVPMTRDARMTKPDMLTLTVGLKP